MSRGNKDSGTGLRLEVTSSLVKGWGNDIFRPESGPRQREERGRFANGRFTYREHRECCYPDRHPLTQAGKNIHIRI